MSVLLQPAPPAGALSASRPVDGDVGHAPRANLGQLPADERFLTWGARFAALGIAWVAAERLLPVHGLAWFVFVAAVANLVILAVGTAVLGSNVAVADRVAQWVISTGMVIVLVALGSVLVFVIHRGWSALHHANFFTHDMSGVGAEDPLSKGGILHAILGSLIELSIASAIALPLGIGTAVYMNEIGGRFARVVRTVVEAMTALPDILAGLFIYTIWIIALGYPRSGLAAGLAITVMMLPIIARASDVVLRVVPGTMREAAFALGASRWATVWRIVLPTARPGLVTALILAIARGVGETAPVLITSGNAPFVHVNPTSGVMNSLPLFIFTSARSGIALQVQRAFGAAAVLLLLVLLLFITARLLARPRTGKASVLTRLRRGLRGRGLNLVKEAQ
ncbi:MAG TPA: phosphate ABC transporter permease PstA [Mycobacteriales bacterium]|nr:phosphate ABC transporter permease PstA [Mycobacteriales bacterium]